MTTADSPRDPDRLNQFLYPYTLSSANLPPNQLLLDANLQEFSNRVSVICALESNGKITPIDAYRQIKALWKSLEAAKKQLDQPPPEPAE